MRLAFPQFRGHDALQGTLRCKIQRRVGGVRERENDVPWWSWVLVGVVAAVLLPAVALTLLVWAFGVEEDR